MGSYTMWVCEWCEGEQRDDKDDGPSGKWRWVGEELMCEECYTLRSKALSQALSTRRGVNKDRRLDK